MSKYHKTSSKTLEERISDINITVNSCVRLRAERIPTESHKLLFEVTETIKEDFKSLFEEVKNFPEVFLDVRQKQRDNILDQDLQKKDVSDEFRSLGEKYNKLRDHIKYADSKYEEKHGGEFSAAICSVAAKFSVFTEEEVKKIILEKISILKRADSNKERKEKTVTWAAEVEEKQSANRQEELANSRTILTQELGSVTTSHDEKREATTRIKKEEEQLKPNPVTLPRKERSDKRNNKGCNIL